MVAVKLVTGPARLVGEPMLLMVMMASVVLHRAELVHRTVTVGAAVPAVAIWIADPPLLLTEPKGETVKTVVPTGPDMMVPRLGELEVIELMP
jgi:hypothetical protein